MSLTLREKEHWKERITRKIDQAIEAILAAEGPSYMQRVARESEQKAYESLGLADLNKQLEELDENRSEIDKSTGAILRKQLAIVRGEAPENIEAVSGRHNYRLTEITRAVDSRRKLIEKERLAQDDIGRRILQLKHEKEELLDTVWLATSSSQIKELWGTVAEVLNQEPTELQKEALSIEPVETK